MLRHRDFLHGRVHPAPGIADIAWFDQSGGTIPAEAWNDREQRTLILRRAMRSPEGKVTILTLAAESGRSAMPSSGCRRRHLPSTRRCSTAPRRRLRRTARWPDDTVRWRRTARSCSTRECAEMSDRFARACPLRRQLWPTAQTRFRLWAPAQETVSVALEDGPLLPMARSPDGWFEATARCAARRALPLSPGGRHAGARSGVPRAGRRRA